MNKNTNIIIVIILVALIIILGAVLLWPKDNQKVAQQPDQNQNQNQGQNTQPADIEITNIQPNAKVTSPLKITGLVRGNGWTGFEGQVGTVKLFDDANNELAHGILTATTDWMQLPTNFETTLTFNATGKTTGKLVFYNENASGEPSRDATSEIPVTFQ